MFDNLLADLKVEWAQAKKAKKANEEEKKKKKEKENKLKKIYKKNFWSFGVFFGKGLRLYKKKKYTEACDIFFYLAEVEKHISAQSALASMYLHGIGTKKNEKNALKYFKLVSEYKIPKEYNAGETKIVKGIIARADKELGQMYIDGSGTLQDWHKAEEYFQKAAKTDYKLVEDVWGTYGMTDRQRF